MCVRCQPCDLLFVESKQTLITIGDKGRSQLSRAAPERLIEAYQDTYKVCSMPCTWRN